MAIETRSAVPDERVDLREYVQMLARSKWLILLTTAFVFGLAGLYSYTRTPLYSSEAAVLVRPVLTSALEADQAGALSSQTETQIATSLPVAQAAGAALGWQGTAQELVARVDAQMTEGSGVMFISFTTRRPGAAAEGANAFAQAYLGYRQRQAAETVQDRSESLSAELSDIDAELAGLTAQIAQAPTAAARAELVRQRDALETSQVVLQNELFSLSLLNTDPGEVIDPAMVPTHPSSPRHALDLGLGLFVGLVLGSGLAVFRDRFRTRVHTSDDLEESLGVPVLATIPRVQWTMLRRTEGRIVELRPRSAAADSYRTLRTGLLSIAARSNVRTILVTSARPDEGKTMTSANLAVALAEMGKETLLVSADLRRPGLDALFEVDDQPGLWEVLRGRLAPRDAIVKTHLRNLQIVPTGFASVRDESSNLLESDRTRDLLAEWSDVAENVIIDTTPILGVPDALEIATVADGVLFVAHAQTSDAASVVLAGRQLERAGARILGAVLTASDDMMRYRGYRGYRGYQGSKGAARHHRLVEALDEDAAPRRRDRRGRASVPSAEDERGDEADHRSRAASN